MCESRRRLRELGEQGTEVKTSFHIRVMDSIWTDFDFWSLDPSVPCRDICALICSISRDPLSIRAHTELDSFATHATSGAKTLWPASLDNSFCDLAYSSHHQDRSASRIDGRDRRECGMTQSECMGRCTSVCSGHQAAPVETVRSEVSE